jgi:DNA-binding CsgD family transcriptional regulator
LIAREAEVERMTAALSAAADGVTTVVLVEGPPGIGKTTLLEAAGQRAVAHDALVLRARGAELEHDLGFGLTTQLLNGPEALSSERSASFLVVLAEVQRSLAALAAERLVVLLIDDAHWGDEPSLRLISCLRARLPHARLAVIIASRPEGARQVPALAALRREAATSVLAPAALDLSESALVLAHTMAAAPEAELERAAHRATGGNPFLVQALGRELAALPASQRSAESVAHLAPTDVIAALADRLLSASGDMRALAEAVAVLGEDPQRRFSAMLAGIDAGRAAAAADGLAALHLLAPGAGLAFEHPLVASAVLATIPDGARSELHRRAAALQAQSQVEPETVAAHLMATFPAGDESAVRALIAAADAAGRRGAPSLAIPFLRRALLEPPAPPVLAPLVTRLALLEARTGDDLAEARLQQALSLCSARGERADLALELSLYRHNRGDSLGAEAAIDRAAVELDPTDRERRLALASALVQLGRRWNAQTPSGKDLGIDPDELTGASEAERGLLVNIAMAEVLRPGTGEQASALARRALLHPGDGRLTPATADAPSVLAVAGHTEEALSVLSRAIPAAEERGDLHVLLATLSARAYTYRRCGRLGESLADGERTDRIARETGAGFFGLFGTAFLIEGLCDQGRLEEAEEALSRAGAEGQLPGGCHTATLLAARGRLRAEQGRTAEAITDFELLGERVTAANMDNPAFTPWRAPLAALLAAQGEFDRAQELVTAQLELARQDGQARSIAMALLAEARLAACARRGETLREALSLAEAAREPVLLAEAQHETGRWFLECGETEAARAVLRQALDGASHAGALQLAQAVRTSLRDAGGRPRRPRLSGPAALTPAERRVATLAAAGHSNAGIASELVVVPRTVELHLTNAYRKLQVASRADLARALAQSA